MVFLRGEFLAKVDSERFIGGRMKMDKKLLSSCFVIMLLRNNVAPELGDRQFKNELSNLKKLSHPHIVKLIGYCYDTEPELVQHEGKSIIARKIYRALCLEYLHNGSLKSFISAGICAHSGRLDWHTSFKIIKGACEGLNYLHEEFEEPIYHLDLKPENILLDMNMVPKLADFGLSRILSREQTKITQNIIGTRGYMPPEYGKGVISKKFDVFSMGVVMIQTISGFDGYFGINKMPAKEFIDQVHDSWREKLEQKWGGSKLEKYCRQVKRCMEIAQECIKEDRHEKPKIEDIVRELRELEAAADEPPKQIPMQCYGKAVADGGKCSGVPVFVMMPLDTVRNSGSALNRPKNVEASLAALKSAGVQGIVVDVWWGIAEAEGPSKYNFTGYKELMKIARKIELKVKAVMSFHQYRGNDGKTELNVSIPLPGWVLEEMADEKKDLCYTDQWGHRNFEYVSLGCDTEPVLKGRTPVKCYSDFMAAFRHHFARSLGNPIIEIQVGLGPAGELRYPSHQEGDGIVWRFPGIGAFQCYNTYMKSSLKAAAEAQGKPADWGVAPTDAGGYHSRPEETNFSKSNNGSWSTDKGNFFLSWYSKTLLDHGDRVLTAATSVFCPHITGVQLSVKVPGIHWHYGTPSHAPELTAGYYNTRDHNGYRPIAEMLAHHGAMLNFSCVEMCNHEQRQDAQCQPEGLVRQVITAAGAAGVSLAGQNALPRYDDVAYHQVVDTYQRMVKAGNQMVAFTYLRMGPDLFHHNNWHRFAAFVHRMSDADSCWVNGNI